jgi:cation:H+ antiporter
MFEVWLPLLGGLVLLLVGGELLVRGAVNVATRLGVSPLVIGLTLVGFGTSMPELVTSVQAGLAGSSGIAYGNIVGSNIANILLIMGVAALVMPIAVQSRALRRDGVTMVAATLVFAAIAAFMPMSRLAGLVFVLALCAYIYIAFRQESTGPSDHGAAFDKAAAHEEAGSALTPSDVRPARSLGFSLVTAIAGLVLVIIGGTFLVSGAVALARGFGISETVIGLTIVAVGTSMPELVTSVVAGLKKQGDVAFGNIVGSNIYNILGIGGFTALIAPGAVPREIATFDNLVMIAVSFLLLAFAFTSRRVSRWEGGVLLALYAGYVFLIWP